MNCVPIEFLKLVVVVTFQKPQTQKVITIFMRSFATHLQTWPRSKRMPTLKKLQNETSLCHKLNIKGIACIERLFSPCQKQIYINKYLLLIVEDFSTLLRYKSELTSCFSMCVCVCVFDFYVRFKEILFTVQKYGSHMMKKVIVR